LIAAVIAAALAGALVTHFVFAPERPSAQRPGRPIVQIVRQQPGLPDLSDVIERLCPSVAVVLPHDADPETGSSQGVIEAPAFEISADGWLVASADALPQGQLDAIFGDGHRVGLSDARTDPVSGLAIVKASPPAASPLTFNDQAFPRVGQFAFLLASPLGRGCSANAGMIASDFLAEGGTLGGYVQFQPSPETWTGGLPLPSSDARVIGVSVTDPAGAVLPAPIAAVIVDELIRNSLAPTTNFGFRAIDYGAPFAVRLGDMRSGAGVALVQPKSGAARAGLQAGDVVVAVNDVPVSGASELNRALDATEGSAVLTIARGGQQLSLKISRSVAAKGQTA
jgi:S1-C subfamily serine protease